jgi:hypothetical protein
MEEEEANCKLKRCLRKVRLRNAYIQQEVKVKDREYTSKRKRGQQIFDNVRKREKKCEPEGTKQGKENIRKNKGNRRTEKENVTKKQ